MLNYSSCTASLKLLAQRFYNNAIKFFFSSSNYHNPNGIANRSVTLLYEPQVMTLLSSMLKSRFSIASLFSCEVNCRLH